MPQLADILVGFLEAAPGLLWIRSNLALVWFDIDTQDDRDSVHTLQGNWNNRGLLV
jgi:hypothetical protein